MKYRDFSEMPSEALIAFSRALDEVARKEAEKASRKRRALADAK